MLFAVDKNNIRTHIKDSKKGEDYFCPICHEKLIARRGKIKIHHFAHDKNSNCTDSWSSDMSEWHINWNIMFPLECQEIVKEKDG